jgi:hypothetical protein
MRAIAKTVVTGINVHTIAMNTGPYPPYADPCSIFGGDDCDDGIAEMRSDYIGTPNDVGYRRLEWEEPI